jgi:hypothetical protein
VEADQLVTTQLVAWPFAPSAVAPNAMRDLLPTSLAYAPFAGVFVRPANGADSAEPTASGVIAAPALMALHRSPSCSSRVKMRTRGVNVAKYSVITEMPIGEGVEL